MIIDTERVESPALPKATVTYAYMAVEHMNNVLRLFFNRVVAQANDNLSNIDALSRSEMVTDTTTSRTIARTDEHDTILFTNGSAVTVIVPKDATDNFAIGFSFELLQNGAGQVTVTAEAGATLQPAASATSAQYAYLRVTKIAANTYSVIGDLA